MREIYLSTPGKDLATFLRLRQVIDERLERVARGRIEELNELADQLTRGQGTGTAAWALGNALRALDRAQRWEVALAAAEEQPTRFRDSARYLAGQTLGTPATGSWGADLRKGIETLAGLSSFDDPVRAAQELRKAAVTVPVTNVFDAPERSPRQQKDEAQGPPPVVHLRFDVDDRPVAWPLALEANRAYPLSVVARADTWPPDAEHLEIDLTGVPSAVISVSPISIPRGAERGSTWMVSLAEISINQNVELKAVARFVGGTDGPQALVVGHSCLRVTTLDPKLATGQPFVAQRIVEMVGELSARIPTLPAQDLKDFVTLMDATAAFASLALERDDLIGIDEREFQKKLKQAFVQDPRIGRDIQEGSRLGGGIVDLMLRRNNDELKVTHTPVDIDDAARLVGQPTQYASGTDSPVGMLTILDDSPKEAAPGVPANYMRWVYPRLHGARQPGIPSMIAVVIVRVGYRKPSEWTNTPTDAQAGTPDQGPSNNVRPEGEAGATDAPTAQSGGREVDSG